MRGASAGKTMYVIPYLMAPPGIAARAVRRRRRAHRHPHRRAAHDPDGARRRASTSTTSTTPTASSAPSTSPATWRTSARAPPDDQRYFVTVADERTILHFGSSYGGNALLGKIAHGLRQARVRRLGVGQVPRRAVHAHRHHTTRRPASTYHICGGFPSASGKTNLAMMLAPDALGDRYHVEFYGDDIAWLWVDEDDGRLYGDEPRVRRLRRRQGHQRGHQPDRARTRSTPGTGTIFTNVAYNADDPRGLVGGPHARAAGRPRTAGWTGRATPIADREPERRRARGRTRTAGSPPRWPTSPTSRRDYDDPTGVPIDAIIFGGRTRDREPLIRAITDLAEGVYDGLTLGAEATFAAEGVEGVLRYDPMSMRPFMAYARGRLRRALAEDHRRGHGAADLRPRQLVPARPGRRPLPVARLPRQPAPAAVAAAAARTARSRAARRRSASSRPRTSSTSRAWTSTPDDLETILLTIDVAALAAGDGPPRGAPRAVRRPARGDLGGAPPRRQGARRRELMAVSLVRLLRLIRTTGRVAEPAPPAPEPAPGCPLPWRAASRCATSTAGRATGARSRWARRSARCTTWSGTAPGWWPRRGTPMSLLVTGVVTRNMAEPLRRTVEATPRPRLVIAVGDCARRLRRVRATATAWSGAVGDVVDVDLAVPGCPPEPEAIVAALRRVTGR